MKVELEYVEHDGQYVTVTDAMGNLHYIFVSNLIYPKCLNTIRPGDKIEFNLTATFLSGNGIVDF